jgi:DNA-binding NtrC family response regulator
MRRPSLLIVDDEADWIETQAEFLRDVGYEVHGALDVGEATRTLEAYFVDLLVLDEKIGRARGSDFLLRCRTPHPGLGAIVLSGYASFDLAVTLMRRGARDLLQKAGLTKEMLLDSVKLALDDTKSVRETRYQRWHAAHDLDDNGIIGESPAIRAALGLVAQVSTTPATVLILGPSGAGKELFARAIHARSTKRNREFVGVNLGAIPDTLQESELFGHTKGAFTGATSDRPGYFQQADGGTIFLDEIADASPRVQVALLRVLQEREVRRLGDSKPTPVDVRVIAATNRDLRAELAAGRFREDLYYRLSVITMTLPPLKDRLEDVPLLARHILALRGRELNKSVDISPEALARLRRYDWPGNVRELDNVLQRAMILTMSQCIAPSDLVLGEHVLGRSEIDALLDLVPYREARRKFQEAYFERQVQRSGDKSAAAKSADVNRSTLYAHIAPGSRNRRHESTSICPDESPGRSSLPEGRR